jgi:DNA-binding CsgD family transcriptional regulator
MSIPLHRLVDISHDTAEIAATVAEDPAHPAWGTVRDAEVGRTLMAESARLLDVDPVRADALCRRALEAGVATAEATIGRARAAWAAGEIDVAASLLEADQPDHGGRPSRLGRMLEAGSDPLIADLRAAIWSARAMMSTADAVYRSMPQQTGRATAHLTAVANGRRTGVGAPASAGSTTRSVALAMLASGLCRTLEPDADPAVLGELARASRLYTSARSGAPLPELPAVVAATAAVGLGETATATNVIDAAITGGQGGRWARRRLLLWGAWIAVQTEQPARARERLGEARRLEHPWTPRDRLLDIAVTVALTRRYDELEDLRVLWDQVRDEIQQATIDLFLILPLATLVSAAARLGDDRTLAPLMTEALQLLAGLGSPPVWAAHLRWAGIQQGILLDRPELLEPHAHALVNAAEHNTVAETMARAGKLWMSVLAGHVDPDAVEAAAAELAGCGLAWDGARLAGHGAARTTDRKTAARLLACARRLHPQDVGHPPAPVETPDEQSPVLNQAGLSDREIEVARLVVQGKTYAEIGKAIFISPRTAEHHIARIRQKLAAESRSDLLSKLRPVLQPEHGATPIPLNPLSNPGAYRGQPRSLTSGGRVASETIAAGRTREERA